MKVTLCCGKMVCALEGVEGSSQAMKIIQRATEGLFFLEVEADVRLEVETVEATEADVVVSVLGIAGVDEGGGGVVKEKGGIHGSDCARDIGQVALMSIDDGGNESAVR